MPKNYLGSLRLFKHFFVSCLMMEINIEMFLMAEISLCPPCTQVFGICFIRNFPKSIHLQFVLMDG